MPRTRLAHGHGLRRGSPSGASECRRSGPAAPLRLYVLLYLPGRPQSAFLLLLKEGTEAPRCVGGSAREASTLDFGSGPDFGIMGLSFARRSTRGGESSWESLPLCLSLLSGQKTALRALEMISVVRVLA